MQEKESNSKENLSSSTKKNSKKSENSKISNSISKSKLKTKKTKNSKFTIICKDNPDLSLELYSEELSVHIISCEKCLKELLLYQAKQEKLNSQLLKKNKKVKKKIKGDMDLNNSMMQKLDNVTTNDEDNSDKDDENNDTSSYEESKSEEENEGLNQSMMNIKNKPKKISNKTKNTRKKKD